MEGLVRLLHQGNYSCVIRNKETRTFTQRGVADLYGLLKDNPVFLRGASVADKVVGKGAAALMILGGIKELYADVISTPALDLLRAAGINAGFAQEVPYIENQMKTGWCPVEKLCSQAQSAEACLPLIERFLLKLGKT